VILRRWQTRFEDRITNGNNSPNLIALIIPEREEDRQDAYATLSVATFKIIIENTLSWLPVAGSKHAIYAIFSEFDLRFR
jgi:hypothetical protein